MKKLSGVAHSLLFELTSQLLIILLYNVDTGLYSLKSGCWKKAFYARHAIKMKIIYKTQWYFILL